MTYTVDPTNPLSPADTDDASYAAAELRALKQLLASYTGGVSSVNQTFKNFICNGDMQFDQENVGAVVTPTSAPKYVQDQWATYYTQASKLSHQQVVDAPPGFKWSHKITVLASYAALATDRFQIYQPIEGQDVLALNLGTANAGTISCQGWFKASVIGVYNIALGNALGNRSYIGSVNITAANTWQYLTFTLTGDTVGTWATDNTAGLYWYIDLGSGSNWQGLANVWQAGGYTKVAGTLSFISQANGSTFQFTGIQIESGSTATKFEKLPVAFGLARCMRYFQKSYQQTDAVGTVTGTGSYQGIAINAADFYTYGCFTFPAPMRAAPSVTIYNPMTGAAGNFYDYTAVATNGNAVIAAVSTGGWNRLYNSSSSWIAGHAIGIQWVANARM